MRPKSNPGKKSRIHAYLAFVFYSMSENVLGHWLGTNVTGDFYAIFNIDEGVEFLNCKH